jgi:AraC-like DNA-binding protein
MLARVYIPGPPLADFVEVLWLCQGLQPTHEKERIMPTGSMGLLINLNEGSLSVYDRKGERQTLGRCAVTGAQSEFVVIDTAQQAYIMGVSFRPGGAVPFLDVPACELHGAHVSLDTLWGAAAGEMRERVLEAATPEAKLRALEVVLLERAARRLERHRAVVFALGQFQRVDGPTVGQVSDQIGLSQRRFIQVFREEVGLTPKLYHRVRRFQQVLQRIHKGQRVTWTDVALDCGYFDQAHFVHDFRAFSGLNPTAYLMQRTPYQNHVPILD